MKDRMPDEAKSTRPEGQQVVSAGGRAFGWTVAGGVLIGMIIALRRQTGIVDRATAERLAPRRHVVPSAADITVA